MRDGGTETPSVLVYYSESQPKSLEKYGGAASTPMDGNELWLQPSFDAFDAKTRLLELAKPLNIKLGKNGTEEGVEHQLKPKHRHHERGA